MMSFLRWLRGKRRGQKRGPSADLSPLRSQRGLVSAHEAGHAIIAWASTTVLSVSVDIESEDQGLVSCRVEVPVETSALWVGLVIKLAGLAGELHVFGRARSGPAEHDLTHARWLAAELVARGYQIPAGLGRSRVPFRQFFREPLSEAEAELFSAAHAYARGIIKAHRGRFWRLVALLHAKPSANEDDLARILGTRLPVKILKSVGVVSIVAPPEAEALSHQGEPIHVRK